MWSGSWLVAIISGFIGTAVVSGAPTRLGLARLPVRDADSLIVFQSVYCISLYATALCG